MTGRLVSLSALALAVALGAGLLVEGWPERADEWAPAGDLVGTVRIVDADTLDVGATRVRLHGVDAPEDAQECLDEGGAPYACGDWATAEARARWDGREAGCTTLDTDRYGRAVARCLVDGEDIGAALVAGGFALAYVEYSADYLSQQAEAEAAGRGLWRGTFQAPWEWRRAPADLAVTDVEAVAAEEACPIKGNISDSGRIYHVPGSRHYDRTRIDEGDGERWFCTEPQARGEGWRPPRG